jgi:hypothetical protein
VPFIFFTEKNLSNEIIDIVPDSVTAGGELTACDEEIDC